MNARCLAQEGSSGRAPRGMFSHGAPGSHDQASSMIWQHSVWRDSAQLMRASSLSYVARALAISQAPAFSFLRPVVHRCRVFLVYPSNSGLSNSGLFGRLLVS